MGLLVGEGTDHHVAHRPDFLGTAMLHAFAPPDADKGDTTKVFGVPSNKLMDQSTLVQFLKVHATLNLLRLSVLV